MSRIVQIILAVLFALAVIFGIMRASSEAAFSNNQLLQNQSSYLTE